MTSQTARIIERASEFKVSERRVNTLCSPRQRYVIGKLLKDESLTNDQFDWGMKRYESETLSFVNADKAIKALSLAIKVQSAIETTERAVIAHKAARPTLNDHDIVSMVRAGKLGKVAQNRLNALV